MCPRNPVLENVPELDRAAAVGASVEAALSLVARLTFFRVAFLRVAFFRAAFFRVAFLRVAFLRVAFFRVAFFRVAFFFRAAMAVLPW